MGLPTMLERPTTTAFAPLMGMLAALEDLHDACRRAGREHCVHGRAAEQAAGVDGVKAVDVLLRNNGLEKTARVHMLWQRELNEDAVDVVASVERVDQREQFLGGDARGRRVHLGVDSELAAGFDFAANVDLRGGVFADEHDGEAGSVAGVAGSFDLARDFGLDLGGDGDAIQNASGSDSRRHTRRIARSDFRAMQVTAEPLCSRVFSLIPRQLARADFRSKQ